jgi:hypothetical protein
MTPNRPSITRLIACTLAAAAISACSPATPEPATPAAGSASAPAPAPVGEGSTAPTEAAPLPPCELTTVTRTIEHLRLASADESCTVLIPAAAAVGSVPVRASATDLAASVEQRTPDGTLYATTGSIELTSVGATLAGQLTASDETPPATGTITTSFSLTVAP